MTPYRRLLLLDDGPFQTAAVIDDIEQNSTAQGRRVGEAWSLGVAALLQTSFLVGVDDAAVPDGINQEQKSAERKLPAWLSATDGAPSNAPSATIGEFT